MHLPPVPHQRVSRAIWLWTHVARRVRPAVLPAANIAGRSARHRRSPPSSWSASRADIEPRKGTAWKVHYTRGLHKGLYITGAWFKRDLGEDWIKILNDARVSELFVPYHQHSTCATTT